MTDCSSSSESTTTTTGPSTSSSPVSVLSSSIPDTTTTMKLEDIRPLKRQKQQEEGEDNATSTSNPNRVLSPPSFLKSVPQSSLLLEYISDDALTALIFSFLGAVGTSQCARVCLAWQTVSQKTQSSQLWREFVRQDFGFELPEATNSDDTNNNCSKASSPATTILDNLNSPPSSTKEGENTINFSKQQPSPTNHIQADSTTNKNNHTKKKKQIDWQQVYTYLARHHQHHQQLQCLNHQHYQLAHQNRLKDATVIFADDGGNFPGYPPSNALRPEKSRVWCTRTGVDTNVDLVIQLDQVSLITGFVAANGGRGYSAPLKEGLVFCSMDPPDLEAARFYNVRGTSSGGSRNNNNRRRREQQQQQGKDEESGGVVGPQWVQYLFQEKTATEDAAAATTATEAAIQPFSSSALRLMRQTTIATTTTSNAPSVVQRDVVRLVEPPPPPSAAAALEPPMPKSSQPPPPPPSNRHPPVASFWFPQLQQAYYGDSEQRLAKPMVGRYVHLKLLSSHSPPGLEDISDNIDLMHFHTLGVPLPSWNDLVPPPSTTTQPVIPDYQYQHERRREALLVLPNHHNHDDEDDQNDNHLNNDNEEEDEEEEEGDEEVFF